MGTKTFSVVSSISMVTTLTVAALSIIGVAITGFYPAIIILSSPQILFDIFSPADFADSRRLISPICVNLRNLRERISVV